MPFLKMHNLIKERLTGRIIAVAEFHEKAALLKASLLQAKLESWFFVFLVTMIMLGLLFVIVHRGNHIIGSQKVSLNNRVFELSDLRNRLRNASRDRQN